MPKKHYRLEDLCLVCTLLRSTPYSHSSPLSRSVTDGIAPALSMILSQGRGSYCESADFGVHDSCNIVHSISSRLLQDLSEHKALGDQLAVVRSATCLVRGGGPAVT
jgi:hypothetical protein